MVEYFIGMQKQIKEKGQWKRKKESESDPNMEKAVHNTTKGKNRCKKCKGIMKKKW